MKALIITFFMYSLLLCHYNFASFMEEQQPCHRGDRLELLQFKKEFATLSSVSHVCEDSGQISHPKTSSWNESLDCCMWDGVTCDVFTGHVIKLDLSCSQLHGKLNPGSSLFQLSHLQVLNLDGNDFLGSMIPQSLGRLRELTHLNLSVSSFHGLIPSHVAHLSRLVSLDVSSNYDLQLDHQCFVMMMKNLTGLEVLSLSQVGIFSEVPMNFSSSLVSLSLSNVFGLHGKLPPSIFQLPRLKKLDLSSNENVTVTIPSLVMYRSNHSLEWLNLAGTKLNFEFQSLDPIGHFKSLRYLNLRGCQLQGHIPESFGNLTNIRYMDLSYNSLGGEIPNSFANLTSLKVLILGKNDNLQGQIPIWLFCHPSLVTLDLSKNLFNGMSGDDLLKCNSSLLEYVDFAANQLSGSIAQLVPTLSVNLTHFDVSFNNFSGIIQLDMFTRFRKLNFLCFSNNQMSVITDENAENHLIFPNLWHIGLSSCGLRKFPEFIKHSSKLVYLDISNNYLKGQPPTWLVSLFHDAPSYLDLSANLFTGMGQLPGKKLTYLNFHSNLLQGQLPLSLCDTQELWFLDLSNNQFTGTIAPCFWNMAKNLYLLSLRGNELSGTISFRLPPSSHCNLELFVLSDNQFEGTLPQTLANCTALQVLDVGNNNLRDNFPWWLQHHLDLQVLVLRSNLFHGSIMEYSKSKNVSFPRLQIIDISRNDFNGTLPGKLFESLTAIATLQGQGPNTEATYVAEKKFYSYSMTLYMKGHEVMYNKVLTTLAALDFSSNRFEGRIPESLGSFKMLKVLNLSHNSLSGAIPTTLGDMLALESLDLSCNQLVGVIPQQMTSITSLAFLNLSSNHLSGAIPQGNQFNTFGNDSYEGNPGLCGFPLSKECGYRKEKLPSSSFGGSHEDQEDDSSFASGLTWRAVLAGYFCGVVIGIIMGQIALLTAKPKGSIKIVEAKGHWKSAKVYSIPS